MLEAYGAWPTYITQPSNELEIGPSPSDVAKKYDREHNFYPQAGPSNRLEPEVLEPNDSQDSLANDLLKVSILHYI